MRKTFVLLACACSMLLASPEALFASEPLKADISADLVSSYIWRGQKLDGASIQPTLGLEWGGLSLSGWGSTGLTGDYAELDFTLAYTVGGFTVGLTDYWCADSKTKYFDFTPETPHVAEINLGYDLGFLSVNWYTNVLGAVGCKADGAKAYASYVELAAPFSLGGLDWSAAVGASPWENDYYGTSGFAVVNCSLTASKELEIGTAKIPVAATLMANPSTEQMFFALALSF